MNGKGSGERKKVNEKVKDWKIIDGTMIKNGK